MSTRVERTVTVGDNALTFTVMEPQGEGWTATVWLDEDLAKVAGADAYDGFVDRFTEVPGIVVTEVEDRDFIHVRSEGLTPEQLLDAVLDAALVPGED
ncbi:hypothetical protein [Demequina sp. NBRC 110057]|uniref:hypothetical protein n=1 Tax=Demequina sp. NBRC 110057 TaxID=1570346 RepID=UPI0011781C2F|nr:hypothetical protein [Demequina sp. NBRC 110057]